jgi:large repetitive protein
VSVTSGTSPYTYSWSTFDNPSVEIGSNTTLSGLGEGIYLIVVSDGQTPACSSIDGVGVEGPSEIEVNAYQNEVCFGSDNGSIAVYAYGGNGNFDYDWSNGETDNENDDLTAGTYTLTVTDGLGCSEVFDFTLVERAQFSVSVSTTNSNCGSSTGSASATITGAVASYYSWNNGSYWGQTINNIQAGTYTVSVYDNYGCYAVNSGVVNNSDGPAVTVASSDITCNGDDNGSISLTVTGNAPFFYTWNNGASTSAISGLVGGSYNVTVSDPLGCKSFASGIMIDEPAVLATSGVITNVTCNAGNNGSVNLTVTGGTMAYTYTWSNSATTEDVSGLTAASYAVTVTDANGCTANDNFIVSEPTAINLMASATDETAANANDGTATVSATGGTGSITFAWSNGGNTAAISSLAPATYTVTATDANSCTATASVTVDFFSGIFDETVVSQVKFYPNPNNGIFTLAIEGNGTYQVVVRNVIGQTIYNNQYVVSSSLVQSIELNRVESGVYFITVVNDGFESTQKMIVR